MTERPLAGRLDPPEDEAAFETWVDQQLAGRVARPDLDPPPSTEDKEAFEAWVGRQIEAGRGCYIPPWA